jgi:uncharacterized protein YndB with AHSA1/START domain
MKHPMGSINGDGHPLAGTRAAIRLVQRFGTPRERVFNAWLEPGIAGRWLFATAMRPMSEVEIDARVGGSFRLGQRQDGRWIEYRGRYLEIDPPRRLVFSLVMPDRSNTRVAVALTSLTSGCSLTLSHENVPLDIANFVETRWIGSLYGLGVTDAETATSIRD